MTRARRLNHVHVLTTDLDRALAFYEGALGMVRAYTSEEDGHTLVFLHIDGTDDVFTLHAGSDRAIDRGSVQHFGFSVEGTIQDAIAAVEAHGGTFIERAGWNPDHVAYVRDPDGYVVELFATG